MSKTCKRETGPRAGDSGRPVIRRAGQNAGLGLHRGKTTSQWHSAPYVCTGPTLLPFQAQLAHLAIHSNPRIILAVVPRNLGEGVPSQAAAPLQSSLHQPHNVAVKGCCNRAARRGWAGC